MLYLTPAESMLLSEDSSWHPQVLPRPLLWELENEWQRPGQTLEHTLILCGSFSEPGHQSRTFS